MKIIHLSDLHLGKRLNEYSLIEDQAWILAECVRIIREEKPDAVILAGDIYDKSVPSAEAVQMFDDFLVRLAACKVSVFVISGNHDSPERLAFGSRLLDISGVYLAPVYDGTVQPICLQDAFGPVFFYMLPFLKPAQVRRAFPDREIVSWTDAIAAAVDAMQMDCAQRNVLIAHQYVTGAQRSESEDISVGGADNVDAAVFDGIDYVALGHIHGPQNIGSERIRYCGTPLKYSFSEAKHVKSLTVAELREKGNLRVRTVPLVPKRDLRELRGTYMELTARSFYATIDTGDYLHITLTDEEDIPDAVQKLRVIYPNLMKLDYDNRRTRSRALIDGAENIAEKTPMVLFGELYEKQNGMPLSDEQIRFASALMESIWEERT